VPRLLHAGYDKPNSLRRILSKRDRGRNRRANATCFAALPEGHALADGDAIHWDSLKDEHFIVSRDAPGPAIHDYIVRRTTTFGRSPAVERHGVGRETLMHLVALGFGISIASEAATATQYPEVVFRPFAAAEDTLP